MEIVWRRSALNDLEAIRDFIAEDNPRAAARVHRAIRAAIDPGLDKGEVARLRGDGVVRPRGPIRRCGRVILRYGAAATVDSTGEAPRPGGITR